MPSLESTLANARRHYQAGEWNQAEELYRQILHADPFNAEVAFALATAYQFQARNKEALAAFDTALRIRPSYAEAHHGRGLVLASLGKSNEARDSFARAIQCQPDFAEAHHNMGVTLARARKLGPAVQAFRRAVELRPDYAEAHLNLARALEEQGQVDQAVASYRIYLQQKPDQAGPFNSLGILLGKQGKVDEAIACFREAIRLEPNQAGFHNNLGAALAQSGKPEESLLALETALRLNPEHPEAHKSRAMTWLTLGNYEQGWPEFEWRWRCKGFSRRNYAQPLWDGSPLAGKTILLYSEQGMGDMLQFARYASLVKERGGTVILQSYRALELILKSCPGVDQVIAEGSPLPPFDTHAPLMSLPRILGTTLSTIPAHVPYLFADRERLDRWRRELGHEVMSVKHDSSLTTHHSPLTTHHSSLITHHSSLKVGIVWQGNPDNEADLQRSIRLTQFAPLAGIKGVHLFSLQKGAGTQQLADITGQFPVTDLGNRLRNFMDTAAALKNLDLLITCDTAVAHLAGALAVPVWVALPYAADWRWLVNREDSPWYPTMRLFRQPELGNWSPVFERMSAELNKC